MNASAPTTTPSPPSPHQDSQRLHRRARHSAGRLGNGLVLLAAVALEAFPVAAWLALLAAGAGATVPAALPLWWLCGVLLVAALVATAFGAVIGPEAATPSRGARALFGVLVLVGWAGSVLISLVLSPAAYLGQSLPQAIASLAADVGSGGGRLGADVGLALLVAYLWWRGLSLTQQPVYRDRVYVRFLIGLGAIILAIAGAAAITGAARTTLISILLLLLVAEVFVGLVGIALAHIADTARERLEHRPLALGEEEGAPVINRAWVTTGLGISALVVVLALGLGLVFSYDTLRTLVGLLQPVIAALGQLLEWILYGFAFLLFLLLNPVITWLKSLAAQNHRSSVSTPSTGKPPTPQPTPTHLPPEWLFAGRLALAVVVVLIVAIVLLRLLRRYAMLREEQGFEEEREALDAGAVLGQQLRDLFARRGAALAGPVEEALEPGTVRYLYRELLRTAARLGHPRRASETPDEYARRLPGEVPAGPAIPAEAPGQPGVQDALAELTSAYDAVRYSGAPASMPASPSIASAWHAILRWLTGADAASARRRGLFRRRT